MADLELTARVAWIDGDEAERAIGFAASDAPEEGYVLVQAAPGAGPEAIYLEVSDEIFADEGALERVSFAEREILLTIRADRASRFGMTRTVLIRLPKAAPEVHAAAEALRALLPHSLIGA